MSNQKRIKLIHGTARVDENCSQETIDALNKISVLAYNKCFTFQGLINEPHFKCEKCGKEEWQHKTN